MWVVVFDSPEKKGFGTVCGLGRFGTVWSRKLGLFGTITTYTGTRGVWDEVWMMFGIQKTHNRLTT